MEYRPFGQTGIDISAIGFGCWEIGGGYGSIEETEFVKAVNRALDVGLNSFDTAEAYGVGASEKSLAKALGSRRKEAVITTKFGVGYPDKPNYRDSSRQRVMESIEKSLKAGAVTRELKKIHFAAPRQTQLFLHSMEQRLGVFQVGGLEAFGEPAVDLSQHRTRLGRR